MNVLMSSIMQDINKLGISNEILDKLMLLVEMKIEEINDRPIDVKIKRTKEARLFPLPQPKKDGDVGFDIPAIMPYKEKFMNEFDRDVYKAYRRKQGDVSDIELEREMRQSVIIEPHHLAKIATGLHLELPHGYWSAIEARSSTSSMKVVVPKGVIDGGYRGEFFANLINIGTEPIEVKHGDRVIQFIVHKNYTKKFNVYDVDELSETDRGDSGFGSTGKHEEIAN